MGREAHILLAILGLLAGAFVGVLSVKLLSPRPPAGAGPDIHDRAAIATPSEIVEPPSLDPPPSTSVVADGPSAPQQDPFASRQIAEPMPLDGMAVEEAVPIRHEEPAGPADLAAAPVAFRSRVVPPGRAIASSPVMPTAHLAPLHDVTRHVAATGDSWWSLAERIYGDGRLYRALFAWNKSINPRVSLVPGTPLELPPKSKLVTAWPDLMPRE
ncbi:MAG: LysM peptidoglycan-binding domain-containing protein [Planctomycetia bacterium]